MRPRLAQLVVASLLATGGGLRAADKEASVKLTGVAECKDRAYALLEIIPRPGLPVIKPILTVGERTEGVEVKDIDTKTGRVRVVNNGVETFYLVGDGEPVASGRTLHFKSAVLTQVLEIYQMFSDRTVLRPPNLPEARIDLQTERLSNTEAVRILEQLLLTKGMAACERGEKFVFVIQTDQTNRLEFISDPPAAAPAAAPAVAPGGERYPPGLMKFQEGDVSQVLEIYQELTGRTVLRPSDIPHPKITVRSQTEMTRAQAIWMLDALLALGDIATVPHGDKFFFVLPGIEKPRLPTVEPNSLSPDVNAQELLAAGTIKFTESDLSQVLSVYASLTGRKPVPLDRTTPAVKLTIRSQTSLTRAEAVFALDALAALNHFKFVLVGDDKVKVLPAALARGETNPVQ